MVSATGVQLAVIGAVCLLIGLGGAFSGWLDIPNSFLPVWLTLCLLGGAMVAVGLDRRPAKSMTLALAGVGVLAAVVPVAIELVRSWPEAPPANPGPPLKLLTFNVFERNFVPSRAGYAIETSGADVVTLQEPIQIRHLFAELAAVYPYQTPCVGQCRQVILSKRPFLLVEEKTLLGSRLFTEQRAGGDVELVRVRTTAPDGGIVDVVTTHLGWPAAPTAHLRQRAALAGYVRRLPQESLILTGDLNLTPWAFAMRRLDADLKPLRRRTHVLGTWPTVVPRLNRPLPMALALLPIDQVFAAPEWRVASLRRLPPAASDHYPVLVEFVRERRVQQPSRATPGRVDAKPHQRMRTPS